MIYHQGQNTWVCGMSSKNCICEPQDTASLSSLALKLNRPADNAAVTTTIGSQSKMDAVGISKLRMRKVWESFSIVAAQKALTPHSILLN